MIKIATKGIINIVRYVLVMIFIFNEIFNIMRYDNISKV